MALTRPDLPRVLVCLCFAVLLPAVAGQEGAGASGGAGGPALIAEPFDERPRGRWLEGSVHEPWEVAFDGWGRVQTVSTRPGRSLQLWPRIAPERGVGTTAALVTSRRQSRGDVLLSARVRTLAQNAGSRSPRATPSPWEVAWLMWNLDQEPGSGDQGTGLDTTIVRRGYYLILKPNGWELGKLDQTLFPGGQRFLASGTDRVFPIGPRWHAVRVQQVGSTIRVEVDGRHLVTASDGPGSGGRPAWGEVPGESVLTSGLVGLYSEDARVQFDDVVLQVLEAGTASRS